MFERKLVLPKDKTETFFLWGPRLTGKTTLLRQKYPNAFWIDLLKADHYRRYLTRPERMREEIEALESTPFVVIDEVQKVPKILDEVHWLHEAHGLQFALCGSSARKVKRGAANLLGGARHSNSSEFSTTGSSPEFTNRPGPGGCSMDMSPTISRRRLRPKDWCATCRCSASFST
jgi:predicted AAA+ superfamily ATPase